MIATARDNYLMSRDADNFLKNVDKLREARGMTERALSMEIAGNPDALRNTRRTGSLPRHATLQKIADFFGVTVADLVGDLPAIVRDARASFGAEPPLTPLATSRLPQDVPVYGTAIGGNFTPDNNGHGVPIESTEILAGERIDLVRRPPALSWRRDVYALYIVGMSMSPRFEPGDLVFVDPKRPASIGDDVIVQLRRPLGDDGEEFDTGLIKRLCGRKGDVIELEQFNPPARFHLRAERFSAMHRVMKTHELLG